ncbi:MULTISPECIES: FadR/GntR family transcriptional regulator [Thalassospira]|uniref:FadR/GntR family transcriptional regulator n=1 Tax=Thalassospira TaxID=168934 RepID=UPI003AA96CA7
MVKSSFTHADLQLTGKGLSKRTVKDQLADKLANMIAVGLLFPGDEMPSERSLVSSLGVSRETVRGAIQILAARGMVEVSQGARSRVIGPDLAADKRPQASIGGVGEYRFEEVTAARELIEISVVREAAKLISDSALARLESLLKDQETMHEDPVRFQISDHVFHETIYRSAANNMLIDIVCDLYGYGLEFRRPALRREGAIARSYQDHVKIFEALRAHDPDAAEAAIRTHLSTVFKSSRSIMDG